MKKSLMKVLSFSMSAATLAGVLVGAAATAQAQSIELPTAVTNEEESVEGGVLKYALVGSAFAGLLNSMFSQSSPDSTVIGFFNEGLYGSDENYLIDDSGFAHVDFDVENKQVTITIPEGHKWDDGEDITIDDVIFPYYVVGHPDYTGIRYGEDYKNIVGMEEYHNGEAEEISGLERVDDYTLRISYINFSASMLQSGGGVSGYIEPEHVLGDIPVAELEDSDAVRVNPVGFGPFKVVNIVPGESVTYERNPYYWRGETKLDGVQLDVVNPSTVVAEMDAGNYDIASLPTDQYETFKDATNYTLVGDLENAYTYIGFKLGTYEDGEVVPDDSRIVANKSLRQAMAYAIDNDAVGELFYNGFRGRATSPIPPTFPDYQASDVEGYPQDVEKAKQLLADAGFVDNDGDGFVEDLNGEPFTLNFASMSGGDIAQPLAEYYMQAWQEIGVNVQLVDGQLMEFNAFYDAIKEDAPNIDVYQAAWGVGGDPNPSGLYGRQAAFNYARWATEENDALLEAIGSDAAFETEFRNKAFADWQAYFMEELPVIPTLYRSYIEGVNNRVKNYDVSRTSDLHWNDVELTADEPYRN